MNRYNFILIAIVLSACGASAKTWNTARGECIVAADGDIFANRVAFNDCMSKNGWALVDMKKDGNPSNDNQCPMGADDEKCYERITQG